MSIDSVAETNRCFLRCTFAAVCGSFNYCCYHDVLKKKATLGINSLLQWYVECAARAALAGAVGECPWSSSSVGGGRGWLPGSRTGAPGQGEAETAQGAAGQRGDTHVGLAAYMEGSQNWESCSSWSLVNSCFSIFGHFFQVSYVPWWFVSGD